MLIEKGNIVEIEQNALVVQVMQQSTCGRCAAQKGCGQGVLAKYLVGSQFVRVALRNRAGSDFSVGDEVELGIDELAILRAAFLVYLIPLLLMILAAITGAQVSESVSILSAFIGLLAGSILVRRQSAKKADDPSYSPIVVDDRAVVRIFSSEPV